jgi:hypothetical protein
MIPVLVMMILHSGAGVPIDLNSEAITNMRNPEPGNKLFSNSVRCQVNMVDGKFIAVRETCAEVRKLMEQR